MSGTSNKRYLELVDEQKDVERKKRKIRDEMRIYEKEEEMKREEEMVDANGNTIKVKQQKKQLTRKEKMAREKQRKMRRELGEEVSDSDDE